MHFTMCSVLERDLCFSCRQAVILSPSVTIKLLSSAKYMGNIRIDECEVHEVIPREDRRR